jgi:cytochrome P450
MGMPAANKGGSPREGDETYLEAHERYGQMRAEDGLPTDAGGTRIVTRYDDVSSALKNVDSFGGTLGYNPELPDDVQILPSIPEPRHGKVRRVISGVIAPHRLAPVEPFVAALSEQLLSKIIGLGPVDLVPSLVDPIPTEAMAFVFGIPREDAARFGQMSDEFLEAQFRIVDSGIGAVHPEFTRYVEALIAARKDETDPPDDVITRLLRADLDGEPLSDVAVRTQMMMLIMAGNETTRNLLGNTLLTLARCPDVFAAMKRDPAVVDVIIEESLRFDAPVQMLFRTCMRPTTLDTTDLAERDQVQLCLGSANRDSGHYESPDEFRIDRENPRDHLSFGIGPHVCPGATLARMEVRIVLEHLAKMVESIRFLPEPPPTFNPTFFACGVKSLWVELHPAEPQ